MSEALFEYRLKVSPRGKSVRLRVSFQHGLEVAIPKGYDESKVPGLLERKRQWVRAALERVESHRKFFEPEPRWRLPIEIRLPAVGVAWHVTSKQSDMAFAAVREVAPGRLLVFGAIQDEAACRAALSRWLMRQTRAALVPRLQTLSNKIGIASARVLVKRQRTRWASCSRRRVVSLNVKLLFLPPEFVDYVMLHELCHVIEMNHSKRFWAVLRQHCPAYRRLDARLREMWKVVPKWAVKDAGGRLAAESGASRMPLSNCKHMDRVRY
jgi:predicted metal-dependent hydrolase